LNTQVINREASDKTKGFRLQKIRAIRLMLETLESQDRAIFYTAIENVEDVSHTEITGDNPGTYYEEDKNYNEDQNFTIHSAAVKNTLVSFFDIYIGKWNSSGDVRLGFYTTASIGKERKSCIVDGAEATLPSEPILKTLSSGSKLPDAVVTIVKNVILEEYKAQYSGKAINGNLTTLNDISVHDFGEFLNKIVWYFGSEDEIELKTTVLQLIKDSKLHNFRVANKEEAIFSILMETLDERQRETSLARRVVNASDVKLIFKQVESEECSSVMDPTWEELKKVEQEITDKRNLLEKIISVCPGYEEKKIKYLARLACRSKTEQMSSNKSFLSLKYRVYEACSEYFFKMGHQASSEIEIDVLITELENISKAHIDELRKDYTYTVSNSQAVSGIIMDLIDSCFISFDEVNDVKQQG